MQVGEISTGPQSFMEILEGLWMFTTGGVSPLIEIMVALFQAMFPLLVIMLFLGFVFQILFWLFPSLAPRLHSSWPHWMSMKIKEVRALPLTRKNFIKAMGQIEGLDNDFCLGCKKKIIIGQFCSECNIALF